MTRHTLLFLMLSTACTDAEKDQDNTDSQPDDTAEQNQEPSGEPGDEPDEPVDLDGDGYLNDVDCDDANANVHPDAEDFCDGTDWNCDGEEYQSGTVTSYEPGGRVNVNELFNLTSDLDNWSQVVLDDIFQGTYKELHVCDVTLYNSLVVGQDTRLIGHGDAVIDPLEKGRGIHINGGSSYVAGFTVTNGLAGNGGGIMCDSEIETPGNWSQDRYKTFLVDLTITGNVADNGGGLYVDTLCPIALENSILDNNIADNGGGAYLKSNVVIDNLVVADNEANITNGSGGGIYFAGERVSTSNNNPPYNAMSYQSIAALATELSVTNNRAYTGGGIYLKNTDIVVTGGTISGNLGIGEGGGITSQNSISRFDSSDISSNTANTYGGAILLLEPYASDGGDYLSNRFVCGSGTRIDRNLADSDSGAVDVEEDSQFRAEDCVFGSGNDANSADIYTLESDQTHNHPGGWWGFCDDAICGPVENCTDGLDNLGNGLIDYFDPTCAPTSSTLSVLELTTDWFDHAQLLPEDNFTYVNEGRDVLYRIDASETSCLTATYANAFSSFTGLFDSNLALIEGKEYLGVIGDDNYTVNAGVYFLGFTPPDNMRRSASFIFDVTVTPGACQ